MSERPFYEMIQPDDMYRALTYDHGMRAGNTLFVAGQVGRDQNGDLVAPFDARKQAELAFENVGKILRDAGASVENIVKVTTYCVDPADFPAVTEVRRAFFGEHRPPHTGLVISMLGSPEVRFEVEVIAVLPDA